MVDQIKHTSTGLKNLLQWFLQLSFSLPLSHIFNLPLQQSSIPTESKSSSITPVPKVETPQTCSHYMPISIAPILARLMEKNSYQGLHLPSCILITVTCFKTGSPFVLLATVALIYLLHTLIELLQTHDCVHVIALDFSKAFDSVRHHSLVSKLATARLS